MKVIAATTAESRAQTVIDETKALSEDGARRRKIAGWVGALKAAEAAAKTKTGATKHIYQVNFRIKNIAKPVKGTYDQRRGGLVELLESLPLKDKHTSTSTWRIELYIEKAIELAELLIPPLAKVDFLSVVEITANRAKFGDADLE